MSTLAGHCAYRIILIPLLLGFAAAFLPVPGAAQEGLATVRIPFYPPVGAQRNPVIVEYTGKRYGSGWRLSQPPDPGVRLLPEEAFLLHMIDTIRRGTVQDFATLWEPEQRAEVMDFYAGKEGLWGQLKSHYQQVTDQRLMNDIHYGDYVLLQVLKNPGSFPPYVTTTVLKRRDGRLYLSNDLNTDAVQFYFATEYASRLAKEFRESQTGR